MYSRECHCSLIYKAFPSRAAPCNLHWIRAATAVGARNIARTTVVTSRVWSQHKAPPRHHTGAPLSRCAVITQATRSPRTPHNELRPTFAIPRLRSLLLLRFESVTQTWIVDVMGS